MHPIKIILAGDHKLVRQGMRALQSGAMPFNTGWSRPSSKSCA